MIHIKTILHPTDFSETAQQAQYVAQLMARDHSAKLVLLHVSRPPVSGGDSLAGVERAQERLAWIAEQIGDVPVDVNEISGEPGAEIVAAAQKCNADLIVMGTHGETGFGRFLIGSVAEHVVRHAPCAVLTLKPGAGWGLSQEAEEAPQKERPAIVM
jgi:nucleotide-binding universal stress UspA family protein